MIDFKKSFPHADSSRFRHIERYDAKVGLFFVGAEDNGEGWWNWWVALAEQGPAPGDRAIYEAGGDATWDEARASIEAILRSVADGILKELQ